MPPAPDLAAEPDDRTRLRQLFEGLRGQLSARECEAASLCYLQGLSRSEAAERMGIGETRDAQADGGSQARRGPGVAGKVGDLLARDPEKRLVRAAGLADARPTRSASSTPTARATRSRATRGECPACRAYVLSLRGLAAVLPLPLLPRLAFGGGTTRGGVAAKAASGVSGSLTAKLAVTAIVVLGAGYGVLGSRAHGSTQTHRIGARSVNVSKPATHVIKTSSHVRKQVRRSNRRSSPAPSQLRHKARSIRGGSSYEFAPEQVGGEAPPVRGPTAKSRRH